MDVEWRWAWSFFQNLIKKNLRDTTRELLLEELTVENLEYQYANSQKNVKPLKKLYLWPQSFILLAALGGLLS
uniref:Uncharacterized protein n=1 Tax=Ditylenchus dipsaci TaxID=166011 RepID=A0A915E8V1_9BILA